MSEKDWILNWEDEMKKPTVASPIEPVVSGITTDEESLKRFARIVFNRAFTLGWFVGGAPEKMDESYKLMLSDLKDSFTQEEVQKLLNSISC